MQPRTTFTAAQAASRTIGELERRADIVDAATLRAHELHEHAIDELLAEIWQRLRHRAARPTHVAWGG